MGSHIDWCQRVGGDGTSNSRADVGGDGGRFRECNLVRVQINCIDNSATGSCVSGGGNGVSSGGSTGNLIRVLWVRIDYIDNSAGDGVSSSGTTANVYAGENWNVRISGDGPNSKWDMWNTARSSCRGGLGNWGRCAQKLMRSECRARWALREKRGQRSGDGWHLSYCLSKNRALPRSIGGRRNNKGVGGSARGRGDLGGSDIDQVGRTTGVASDN